MGLTKLGRTGVKHIKNCIECGIVLEAPVNWWFSFVGKKHYKCIDCYDIRRTENTVKKKYKEGKQPSPKLLAKLLGRRHKAEYNSIQDGHVYIISNPAWVEWYKVGMAVDATDRCKAYQTSSPFRDYKVSYSKYFDDRREAEKLVHTKLKEIKIKHVNEWFKSDLKTIKNIIKNIKDVQHET